MFYAEECGTRHRESLQAKNEAEARRLIAVNNQAASQSVCNMEMAKVCCGRRQGVKLKFDPFSAPFPENAGHLKIGLPGRGIDYTKLAASFMKAAFWTKSLRHFLLCSRPRPLGG